MQHTINLIVGDPSGDGHGKTYTQTIHSNFSIEQINNAYKLGSEKLGFNLVNDIADSYEDSSIANDHIKVLEENSVITRAQLNEANGYDAEDSTEDEDTVLGLSVDEYLIIYLGIVKLGDDTFTYELVIGDEIEIGGYGLLS